MENRVFSLSQDVEHKMPTINTTPSLTSPSSPKNGFDNLQLELKVENSVFTNGPCQVSDFEKGQQRQFTSKMSGEINGDSNHKIVSDGHFNGDSCGLINQDEGQTQVGAGRHKLNKGKLRLQIPQTPSSPMATPTQNGFNSNNEMVMSRNIVNGSGGGGHVFNFSSAPGINSSSHFQSPTAHVDGGKGGFIADQPCVFGHSSSSSSVVRDTAHNGSVNANHRPVLQTQESIHDPSVRLMHNHPPTTPVVVAPAAEADYCHCGSKEQIIVPISENRIKHHHVRKQQQQQQQQQQTNRPAIPGIRTKSGGSGVRMNHEDSHSTLVNMDYNNYYESNFVREHDRNNFPHYHHHQQHQQQPCRDCECSKQSYSSYPQQPSSHWQHHQGYSHSDHYEMGGGGEGGGYYKKKSSLRKWLCYGFLLLLLISVSSAVSVVTLYLLNNGDLSHLKSGDSNEGGTVLGLQYTGGTTDGSVCVPCQSLQLSSDVEDDKTKGLERSGEDCCARNAQQLEQIIQAIAEKEVRINNNKQPSYQYITNGSVWPSSNDRNLYAAHVYLGPDTVAVVVNNNHESSEVQAQTQLQAKNGSTEGGGELQGMNGSSDIVGAAESADNEPFIGDEYVVLKSWDKSPETAFVRNGIDFSQSKGRFQVKREGIYKVYSHLAVKAPEGGAGQGLVFTQKILKENIRFSSSRPDVVLEDTQLAPCPDIQTNHACHSSTLDSLLYLRKNDEIFVESTHNDLVIKNLRSSFFGIYRIE